MSNFSFIADDILRSNLDSTFDHIVDLVSQIESDSYKNKPILVSSLRKTVVIHTASIIEALCLWILKSKLTTGEAKLTDDWTYFDIRKIYELNSSVEIIAGKRKKVTKNIDHLDFLRILDVCYKCKAFTDKKLYEQAHEVRKLRNRLHIGGLKEHEREYTKNDLIFVFDVAKKVKELASKL